MIVSLVVITASRNSIPMDSEQCDSDVCIRTLDSAWRWIVGFGSLPAVVALFFRLTIPESPRYLLDVVGAVKGASKDTQEYYNGDAFGESQELLEDGRNSQEFNPVEHAVPKSSVQGSPSPSPSPSPDTRPVCEGSEGLVPAHSPTLSASARLHPLLSPRLAPADDQINCNPVSAVAMCTESFPSDAHTVDPVPANEQLPPQASWEDANNFFIKEKNWVYLLATSSTWFCLDEIFLCSLNESKANTISSPSTVWD